MNIDSVGPVVLETLRDSEDLADIASKLGDLSLDEFLDEGLAKNIPVVELFRKVCKATESYSNYLLTKKLVLFLRGLSVVSVNQRRDQIAKLAVDMEYRQRVGENLMLLLDKLNDMRKPEMLSCVWRAYLESRIDSITLFALNHAIEQIHVEELPVLRDLYRNENSTEGLTVSPFRRSGSDFIEPPYSSNQDNIVDATTWRRLMHVAMCGLVDQFQGRGGAVGGQVGGLRLNSLGRTFVELIFT